MTIRPLRRWLPALVLASVVIPSLPRLVGDVRQAARLMPLSWEERRAALMPGWYDNVRELRRHIAPGQTIAAITPTAAEINQAIFLNYYIFPGVVRLYASRWAYLGTPAGERPSVIVDAVRARAASYAEIRNQEIQQWRVVQKIVLPGVMRGRFIIPVVSSTDGLPPASYTVEGALAGDEPARVTLILQPAGIARTIDLRGVRTFNDVVYECFGVMEFAAWIEVSSDRPIRAAFWFVNRVARRAVPIHIAGGPLRTPAAFPQAPAPTLLWLLNPSSSPVVAHAGSHPVLLMPHQLTAVYATGAVSGPVYAFLARKMPDGSTRFTWPEDLR